MSNNFDLQACPFNPNPETAEGANISEEFSECFTPAIRNVVNFAKCIPGFLVLSQEDQVTLLKVTLIPTLNLNRLFKNTF